MASAGEVGVGGVGGASGISEGGRGGSKGGVENGRDGAAGGDSAPPSGASRHGSPLTDEVLRSFAHTPDPRPRLLFETLVKHLHAFIEDARPTEAEWMTAVEFLSETGRWCDPVRQEFILLSDVLGASSLVDSINHASAGPHTESTVLGPFHVTESPRRALGADIAAQAEGSPCVVAGRVLSPDGEPLPGATVDVWQADGEGFYDVQRPDSMPSGALRGLFKTDAEGRFWFRTVVPKHYAIPTDGPVGTLLRAAGRHPFRPAHIHLIGAYPGFEDVTTHVFVAGSPYIGDDAVFGVKASLVRAFELVDDADAAARYGESAPFRLVDFDLVLPRRVG